MPKENVYYWPHWLAEDLNSDKTTDKRLLERLGQNQINLWRALNIYDDFFDNKGNISELPLANSYLRKFINNYHKFKLSPTFYQLLDQLMAQLEKANLTEIQEMRLSTRHDMIVIPKKLPDFSELINLSAKSLPLALGPIAILMSQEQINNDKRAETVINFFKYALAAKQLSDDAKDWMSDLKNKIITPVNNLVLMEIKKKKNLFSLTQDLEEILIIFIKIIPQITKNIIYLCHQAREELKKTNVKENGKLLKEIIIPLEHAAQKSLKYQRLLLENSNDAIM